MLYKPWDLRPPGGVAASEEVHSDDAEIQSIEYSTTCYRVLLPT